MPPSKLKQTIHIRAGDNSGPPEHGGKTGKIFGMFPFSHAVMEVTGD